MSTFSDIAAKVDAFAHEAVLAGEKTFTEIVDALTEGAADALEKVEPVVERSLLALVDQLGATASALVVSLFGAAGAGLTGSAKANLAATSLVEAAFKKGITVVDADASVLIKNAFTAIEDRLRSAA